MPRQEKPAVMPATVLVGPCQIPRSWIEAAKVLDYRSSGVVLADERQKHTIAVGDTPIVCTISLVITREGVGNAELEKISTVKEARDAKMTAQELKERDAHRAEIKSAVDITKQTMIETSEMFVRQAKPPNVADQIKDAMATMQVLQSFIPAAAK